MHLTHATESDIPAIQAIYAHYVMHTTVTLEETPPSLAQMTARWHDSVEKDLPFLVAKAEGQVLGYAYATSYRSRSAYRFTVEESVYIAKDHRRKKIGEALLSAVLEECRARGLRQCVAVVGDARNEASIALHKRLGFVEIGRFKKIGFKQNTWLDSALLQKEL